MDMTLPYSFAKRFGVVIQKAETGAAKLFYRPNTPVSAFAEITRLGFHDIELSEINEEEFDQRLAVVYQQGGAAADIMDDIGEAMNLDEIAEALGEPEDLMESQDDAPVIRLINAMLTESIRHQASDIHIEPFENSLKIRYRVDGIMRDLLNPPRKLAPLIISRLKVMSKLDIAEKRIPQDGRISLRVAGRAVDVRVSTLPNGHGERVVLRLLDKQAGKLDLSNLGMDAASRENLESLLETPHGILLVTGPTGSGKTTTLYGALSKLNTQRNTILTVEDPVEYHLEGIGQTQVNTKVNLDFARGLRAILRQDPDIVMVGEVRDLETAEIAVQASLTGHMVLSTLHTNTAVGAVTRLRDMGVEPFLLSSSLIGVVAQRLVRRLCEHCKVAGPADDRERQWLGKHYKDQEINHPGNCEKCNFTGYSGRSGVYEVTPVASDMRTLIHDGASESELEIEARKHTPSIADDGRRLVMSGITSVEEVLRVIQER